MSLETYKIYMVTVDKVTHYNKINTFVVSIFDLFSVKLLISVTDNSHRTLNDEFY